MQVTETPALLQVLIDEGFAFVRGATMRPMLETAGSVIDWPEFAASWDRLEVDAYLADQGRYRRRRHGVFHVGADLTVVREADQPHYQSLDYNPLFGGIPRVFAPIEADAGAGASLRAILRFCGRLF